MDWKKKKKKKWRDWNVFVILDRKRKCVGGKQELLEFCVIVFLVFFFFLRIHGLCCIVSVPKRNNKKRPGWRHSVSLCGARKHPQHTKLLYYYYSIDPFAPIHEKCQESSILLLYQSIDYRLYYLGFRLTFSRRV
jgi:hypothetical protein